MPTQKKIDAVEEMRQWIERCAIAISADYTGMPVGEMTELRRALRERGVEFRVVKNRLAYLAADAAGRPEFKEIVTGPTAIAIGYEDSLEPAKALSDFVRTRRTTLTVKGGLLGDRYLTADQVAELAALPTKDVLIARLVGQLQAPIVGVARVLNGPVAGLATVLQRRIGSMEQQA